MLFNVYPLPHACVIRKHSFQRNVFHLKDLGLKGLKNTDRVTYRKK